MSLDKKVSDWQVCAAMQAAGADLIGAGLFIFDFYSKSLDLSARFKFRGGGVGAGGNASGTTVFEEIGQFGPWTEIGCDEPFCVWDLNGAWGRISALSGGVGLLFGFEYITAAPPGSWTRSYFHSQNVGGFSYGTGAGGFVFVGSWRFAKVCNNKPSPSSLSPNIA
jgi:hypothetical protein